MKFKRNHLLLLCTASMFAVSSTAAIANGGHFLVDDATITEPGECQIESWFSRTDGNSSIFFAPACSTINGWELSLPVAYNWSNSELAAIGFEAKTVLSTYDNSAIALSMGIEMDAVTDEFAGGFINIPYSYAMNAEWELHANFGSEYTHENNRWEATWGAASTYLFTSDVAFIAEAAATGSNRPTIAAGVRKSFRTIDIDASVARDHSNNDTIYTVGLNFAF